VVKSLEVLKIIFRLKIKEGVQIVGDEWEKP
jgi:hypothetical protein